MNKHSEIQGERVAWSHFWINKGLIAVEVLPKVYNLIFYDSVRGNRDGATFSSLCRKNINLPTKKPIMVFFPS